MREHFNSITDEEFLADYNTTKDWGGVTVNDYLNGAPMHDPNIPTEQSGLWEIAFPAHITEEVARNPLHENYDSQLAKARAGGFPYLVNGFGDKLIYKRSNGIATDDDRTALSDTMYFLDNLKDKLNSE
jgi:hypothetical protein